MAKMRDLVWRSSLRKRAFADLDLLSPRVFEITDHVIPAGTDPTVLLELGRAEDLDPGAWVGVAILLELAERYPGDNVSLEVYAPGSPAWDFGTVNLHVTDTRQAWASETGALLAKLGYQQPMDEVVPPLSLHVSLNGYNDTDGGPTTTDLHVTRARAAIVSL